MPSTLLWLFASITMFSVIILLHELWHFKAARIFWVKVYEFGLWLPPKAKTIFKDKKWTIYTLNWLPLWGFVRLKWERFNTFLIFDENKKRIPSSKLREILKSNKKIFNKKLIEITSEQKEIILKEFDKNFEKDSLIWLHPLKQSIIILAWVFMNFLLAFIIFSILFFTWIKPLWINNKIPTNTKTLLIPTLDQALDLWFLKQNEWILLYPLEKSIAEKSGIQEWDILYEVYKACINTEILWCKNWQSLYLLEKINSPENLINLFEKHKNKELALYLNKNLETNAWWKFIGVKLDENWKIWTYVAPNYVIDTDFKYNFWFFESIKYWATETYNQWTLTIQSLKYLFANIIKPETPQKRTEAINELSWPIWIVGFITKSISYGFSFILLLWAIISINLWVFNLLPIPALDWWRFVILFINSIIEKIFWKKIIWEFFETILHLIFFLALISASFFIAYNDILKLIK